MLRLKKVSKYYGNDPNMPAVENLDLRIYPNEFVCILGRSGCGKTSTLRMIAGLEDISRGSICLNGRKITGPGADRCVVFQRYTLFPWRNILSNIAFGLEIQGLKKAERERIAMKYLTLVGLGDQAQAYPYQLSGGMQQRVAVARALATDPAVLLMDEPFGALDAQTRMGLQSELINIWQADQKTILFVTHSIDEAICLGDRIIIMKSDPGRIHQIIPNTLARPRVHNSPASSALYREIHASLETI
jgi:NitT/TauT family transport system ATP-binding protein